MRIEKKGGVQYLRLGGFDKYPQRLDGILLNGYQRLGGRYRTPLSDTGRWAPAHEPHFGYANDFGGTTGLRLAYGPPIAEIDRHDRGANVSVLPDYTATANDVVIDMGRKHQYPPGVGWG
jgi:hypothetical protein